MDMLPREEVLDPAASTVHTLTAVLLGHVWWSGLAAVGFWHDVSVRLLNVPDLSEVAREQLGGEIIPRSVLFAHMSAVGEVVSAPSVMRVWQPVSSPLMALLDSSSTLC